MNEEERIRRLAAAFPRDTAQENGTFECDAELVRIGGELWGMSIDEFTPDEDLFTAGDPARLGRNLATATVSDLLAAGGLPRFFMSSLALPHAVDPAWMEQLAGGLAAVLAELSCAHCGGDLGRADPWRFNGVVTGPIADGKPLTHRIPESPQALCVTGTLGDFNLAAFRGTPTPAIELRTREAALIRRIGTACVDTSGGFLDALWLLHRQNPGHRFLVDGPSLPYAAGVLPFATAASIPAEATLIGGAGEYELLFTIPSAYRAAHSAELAVAGITVVGEAEPGNGAVRLRTGGRERPVTGPPPDPRTAASAREHARSVVTQAREWTP